MNSWWFPLSHLDSTNKAGVCDKLLRHDPCWKAASCYPRKEVLLICVGLMEDVGSPLATHGNGVEAGDRSAWLCVMLMRGQPRYHLCFSSDLTANVNRGFGLALERLRCHGVKKTPRRPICNFNYCRLETDALLAKRSGYLDFGWSFRASDCFHWRRQAFTYDFLRTKRMTHARCNLYFFSVLFSGLPVIIVNQLISSFSSPFFKHSFFHIHLRKTS